MKYGKPRSQRPGPTPHPGVRAQLSLQHTAWADGMRSAQFTSTLGWFRPVRRQRPIERDMHVKLGVGRPRIWLWPRRAEALRIRRTDGSEERPTDDASSVSDPSSGTARRSGHPRPRGARSLGEAALGETGFRGSSAARAPHGLSGGAPVHRRGALAIGPTFDSVHDNIPGT